MFLPSAGVGRTGTFIALDVLLRQLERERFVGAFSYVRKMRESRPLMLQTEVMGFPRAQGGGGGAWGESRPRLRRAPLTPYPVLLPRPSTCSCTSASCGVSSSHP